VLCERSLFVVAARTGDLLLQRRLEYHPACCWPYPAAAGGGPGGGPGEPAPGSGGGPDSLLVATYTQGLQVYQGPALAWAARLELQPVAVRVADVGGARGMIVALDDAGKPGVLRARRPGGSMPPLVASSQEGDVTGSAFQTPAVFSPCRLPAIPCPPARPLVGGVPWHRPPQRRGRARGRRKAPRLRRDGRRAPAAAGGDRGGGRRGRGAGGRAGGRVACRGRGVVRSGGRGAVARGYVGAPAAIAHATHLCLASLRRTRQRRPPRRPSTSSSRRTCPPASTPCWRTPAVAAAGLVRA
jgi:hypothetical protein